MTGPLLPSMLAGLAVAAALARPRTAGRATAVATSLDRTIAVPDRWSRRAGAGRRPTWGPAHLGCLLGGVAVALLLGTAAGLALGALVAAVGPEVFRRCSPPAWRLDDDAVAQDLPLALDLLAACLHGGATLAGAVGVVAEALPGACGSRLARVGAALAVGSPAADAWLLLGARLEGDVRPPVTAVGAAARALSRAADTGAPVAAAVSRIAESARLESAARAGRAARRAGVLAVGPLGLCFLPAFVLVGVVPAVMGLAGPLLSGL